MITIINVNEFFPNLYLIRSIGKVNKTKNRSQTGSILFVLSLDINLSIHFQPLVNDLN